MALGFVASNLYADGVLSAAPAVGSTVVLSATGRKVYNITLVSPSATLANTVTFFDQSTLADPLYGTNYLSAAFTNRVSWATNYVTSYVGYNGVTNAWTNVGTWSVSYLVAASTNALTPAATYVVGPAGTVDSSVDFMFTRGIVYRVTTNALINVYYRD